MSLSFWAADQVWFLPVKMLAITNIKTSHLHKVALQLYEVQNAYFWNKPYCMIYIFRLGNKNTSKDKLQQAGSQQRNQSINQHN